MPTHSSTFRSTSLTTFILACFPLALHANDRLWDKEKSLWEEAQSFKIVRPLSANFGWEGPAGTRDPSRGVPPAGPGFAGPLGQGVNMSNSRVQSSLWGTPDRLVISISKTDVINRAGISFTRGKKPVGQILLMAPDLAGAEQPPVTTHVHDGVNTLTATKDNTSAKVDVMLSDKESNVFTIRARYRGLTQAPAVRLYRHKDRFGELPDPESGDENGFFWIRQSFAAEKTFPDGFDYYLVGRIARNKNPRPEHAMMREGLGAPVPFRDAANPGTAVTATAADTADQELVIHVTVVTRAESDDPLATAKRRLQAAEKAGFERLRGHNMKTYRGWFEDRERGRIFTGDFADARDTIMPFLYQSAFQFRHTYNSNPDPTRFEGDANYNQLESDEVNWSGLPCFNEELYTGDFVAGRDETVGDYYVKLFNFWRPAWEEKSKSMGHHGLLILRGYVPPIKNDVYSSPDAHAMNGKDWASMVWAFKSVWDAYDYGDRDEAFLKEKVYPSLSGIADFFASLVVMKDDGFYHIEQSQVREEDHGQNAIDCIGAAKWAFRTAIQASSTLKADADKRKVWQERLDKMKPYDIIENDEGEPILASLIKDGKPVVAGHGGAHFLVNLADEINLQSPRELRETAIRSNLFRHGQPMNRQVEYLLGDSPDTLVMTNNYGWIHMFAHPAWLMYYAQKSGQGDFARTGPLDTQARKTIACWLEPERLCNSRSGTIFFFPAVPTNIGIAFKDFQARGSFLVSGELKDGKVTHAEIHARRNGPCSFMNPWPGKTPKVRQLPENTIAETTADSDKLTFNAQAGKTYLIVP
jgi:hypothetical protein